MPSMGIMGVGSWEASPERFLGSECRALRSVRSLWLTLRGDYIAGKLCTRTRGMVQSQKLRRDNLVMADPRISEGGGIGRLFVVPGRLRRRRGLARGLARR